MVTYQTDSKGQPVSCILLEECTDIERELYLGLVIDRSSKSIAVIASPDGGVDIESVAENNPEKIFKVFLDSSNKIKEFSTLVIFHRPHTESKSKGFLLSSNLGFVLPRIYLLKNSS